MTSGLTCSNNGWYKVALEWSETPVGSHLSHPLLVSLELPAQVCNGLALAFPLLELVEVDQFSRLALLPLLLAVSSLQQATLNHTGLADRPGHNCSPAAAAEASSLPRSPIPPRQVERVSAWLAACLPHDSHTGLQDRVNTQHHLLEYTPLYTLHRHTRQAAWE